MKYSLSNRQLKEITLRDTEPPVVVFWEDSSMLCPPSTICAGEKPIPLSGVRMSSRELQEKYGAKNTRQAICRAIRAEFPDGEAVLDECTKTSWHMGEAHEMAMRKRDAYEEEIRKRYGMPPIHRP